MKPAKDARLTSDDHFTVDCSLIQSHASLKSKQATGGKSARIGHNFHLWGGKARAIAAERMHLVALRHTPQAREKLAQFLKPAV